MDTRMYCPECGREEEHQVLSKTRGLRVRCQSCGTVTQVPEKKERAPLKIKAIVSEEDRSKVCIIELATDEICRIGDHHVAVCGEEYSGVEISAIERGEQRVRRSRAKDITTLWTRKIEQVHVRVSVHDGKTTIPILLDVSGEEPFVVGEVYRRGNRRFRIANIKLRDGDSLRREGQKGIARRIKRIYAYPL
jgi:uncharacterized Zn finger protein